jgi:hypothetical protein
MTARKNLPANNLKELAEWLKHNNASASTVGCGMAFQKASGTDFQFIPYRGGAPALQDLDYRFRESCHKRGIHLSFQAPICAGALRMKD